MNSHVHDQRGDSREGFPTLIALVGLLARVNIVMLDEVLLLPENCSTLVTLVGLLSDVNLLMLSQI